MSSPITRDNNKKDKETPITRKELIEDDKIDHGFVSGPQTSSKSLNANNKEHVEDTDNEDKKINEDTNYFDSGCISEYDSALLSKEVSTGDAITLPNNSTDQMIIDKNIDNNASEWFCKLNLNSETPNSQEQQREADNPGMNNLNSSEADKPKNASTITSSSAIDLARQFFQQNDDGDTPLHLACISESVDVVAALIGMAPHPCLLNVKNDNAQTPLHLAALTGNPKILRMLLIAGAESTTRDRRGNTALHLSCISGNKECVRAVIMPISAAEVRESRHQQNKQFSDLEVRNYNGQRCVHLAAEEGQIDILRDLVGHGANINAREGKSGRTPLHIAIEGCNEDLANFLLDECQKLNLEAETYGGLTAYQMARILNKHKMQDILEKRGVEQIPPPDSD